MSSSFKREIQFYKDIKNCLYKKYYFSPVKYNKSIIENILYNQKYHIVSLFKEILIYDDPGEFFKRFYYLNESILKIKTYCDFYEKNSKIFPNYITLSESKIIFKNIKKKQKMLDNLNNDNNDISIKNINKNNTENKSKNNEEIFSKTIINSILSDNSSQSSSNDQSIRKLIKNICDYENQYSYRENNENQLSNLENHSQYIYVNSNKIDYNLNKNHLIQSTNKHHCKKFIKEFKFASKLINSGTKTVNEKKYSKQNLSGINNVFPFKKSNDKSNIIINNKQSDKIEVSKILKNSNNKIEDKSKSKSKSRSKNKDILTERTNKSKSNNTNNSIQKKTGIQKKIKKPLIYINNINQNENKTNKEETKSMPKLITSLNKTSGINKIQTQHKTLFSANNKKNNKHSYNNYYNNHIKSSLKFTNIKLQKYSSNFEIKFHNAPLSNYITKHIPSLHISLNHNFKNTSTLSKSKSKSKSNSKSKSKSPINTSNSLNRKFRNHNTITSFNKSFKHICNNIRTLIHKDILLTSDEGLQTERLKYKNNTNPIKSISINKNIKKNNLIINNNNNNNKNIVKRNIHKKIISVTPSIEYTKIVPKTTREINSNYLTSISGSLLNKSKFLKENLTSDNKILNSSENNNKLLNSPLNKRKNINDKNNSNISKKSNNQNIIGFINSRRNSSNKTNNLLYSHNYTHHPVKKIRTFDNINILTTIKSPKKKYTNNNNK